MRSTTVSIAIVLSLIFGCLNAASAAETQPVPPAPSDMAVMASASVSKDPPSITISWPSPQTACTSYTVYRRALGERDWTSAPIAELPSNATSMTDSAVQLGVAYEYRIDRLASSYHGCGYLCGGIELPLTEERGSVLLLVESSVAKAMPRELDRLRQDLIGDGWTVVRLDVPRSASVSQVKKMIRAQYRKDPAGLKSLFIFGHVAVPYAGETPRDGHYDHTGAWPADVYYGTMDFQWTDTADITGSYRYGNARRNWNKPGDGKFDQSCLPANSVQLQVGRVDLSDLPLFHQQEVELLRQYLNKDHRFRHAQFVAERRGVVNDNFGLFSGWAMACAGWYTQSAFFSAKQVSREDWFPATPREKYLLAGFDCGAGSYTTCGGVGDTEAYTKADPGFVFNTLWGSWFGDWDSTNNLLRAVLASPNAGLTAIWSGYPPVTQHHMGLGLPIGYSVMRTQNSGGGTDYPAWGFAKDGKAVHPDWYLTHDKQEEYPPIEYRGGDVKVGLMGDPTLRMFVVAPPSHVKTTVGNEVTLTWLASADAEVGGYQVYRGTSLDGPFTRLTQTPITACSYSDATRPKSSTVYMVKAVKLERTGSGTFYNASQGVFVTLNARRANNDIPTVSPLSCTTKENQSVSFTLRAKGGGWDYTYCFSQPRHGVLTGTAPWLTYIPNTYYYGPDSFTYTVEANEHESASATVSLQVTAVQDTPVAGPVKVVRNQHRPVACPLVAVDYHNHPLTYKIVTPPKYGTVSGADTLTPLYTPTTSNNVADSFRYIVSDGTVTSEAATVTLEANEVCPRCTVPIVIDGDINEWPSLPYDMKSGVPLSKDQKSTWHGPKDCFYRFGVCRDTRFVYFGIEVTDDKIHAIPNTPAWQQDGAEFRIDARPDAERSFGKGANEGKDFVFLAICPTPNAATSNVYHPERLPSGSRYVCVLTNNGYVAEIAIPVTYFQEKGGEHWDGFRLNVAVDDMDDDGLRRHYNWKPDWRSWAVPSYEGSGMFILE